MKRLLRRSLAIATVLAALALVPAASALTEKQKLTAPDGFASDKFGYSVAISGDTLIVGAVYDDVGGNTDQGSAYVFVRSGGAWSFQQQLVAPDGTSYDYFGHSVAISGDRALVGAPFDDVRYNLGTVADVGSAYVFVRNPSTGAWTYQVQLLDTVAPNEPDHFGWSVALDGDTALVGAPDDDVYHSSCACSFGSQGSAYAFVWTGTWGLQKQLTASDGDLADKFGASVALDGETALVGATSVDVYHGSNLFVDQGSAYAFLRSGTTWTQQTPKLVANNGDAFDSFGHSVAIDGDTAIAGAPYDEVGANGSQGTAYAFTRSGGSWIQQAQLIQGNGSANDNFGFSVALKGDTALLGAPYNITGPGGGTQGSVYVFTRSVSAWAQNEELKPYWAGPDSPLVGWSVAFDGATALLGAPDRDETYANQGSVYVFAQPPTAVAGAALSARRSRGAVVVRWHGADPNVLGFRVYREQAGKRVRLTPGLVTTGASGRYRYVDRSAPAGPLRYRLQAVRTDGTTSWAGSART